MGGRTDSDGRLDLDELGSVIESATAAPATELLEDGVGRPSITEHLEAAGVTSWMRRHRPVVGGAAALALGGLVALAVHQAAQPPPLDPRVVAQVTEMTPPLVVENWGAVRSADDQLAEARLVVAGVPAGDDVRITGISGPGLGASGAVPRVDPEGVDVRLDPGAVVWTAAATYDCASPRALSAEGRDFAVTLARTDAWHRTVRAAVPLPGADRWADQVRRTCWDRAVQQGVTVEDLSARPDPQRGTVSLGLVLRNDTPLDLVAGSESEDLDAQGVRVGQSFRVALAAGQGAQTEVLLSVTSCDRAATPVVGVQQGPAGSVTALQPGLSLFAASPGRDTMTQVPLVLDRLQAAGVQGALDVVCAGAPDIAPRPVGAPVVQALGGPLDERQMRIALDVRTTFGTVGSVEVAGDAGLPTVFSATSTPERPGRVEAVWRYTCANTPAPPRVSVTVTDGTRSWPWRGLLEDESIERAVLRGCTDQTSEALRDAGWPARDLVAG